MSFRIQAAGACALTLASVVAAKLIVFCAPVGAADLATAVPTMTITSETETFEPDDEPR